MISRGVVQNVERLALLAAGITHGAWLATWVANFGSPEAARRDYRVFWEVSQALRSGELSSLYGPVPGGFPFLHPPPVAVLSLPLAWLSVEASYLVFVGAAFASLIASIWAVRALVGRVAPFPALVLASAPWLMALALGQPAPLWLALWLVGLALYERGRFAASGAVLAGLMLKPTLGLVALVWLIHGVRRPGGGRALGAFSLVTVGLVALSLPLGLERWSEFLVALERADLAIAALEVPLFKQHTLRALLLSVAPAAVARPLYVALSLAIVALVLDHLTRSRPSPRRAAGLFVLAGLVLSPYAYAYDALVLAIPALAFFVAERPRHWTHAASLMAFAATFVAQHVSLLVLQRGSPIAALFATLWLLAELPRDRSALTRSGADLPIAEG